MRQHCSYLHVFASSPFLQVVRIVVCYAIELLPEIPDSSCTYRHLQCKASKLGILCLLFAIEAQLIACWLISCVTDLQEFPIQEPSLLNKLRASTELEVLCWNHVCLLCRLTPEEMPLRRDAKFLPDHIVKEIWQDVLLHMSRIEVSTLVLHIWVECRS